MFCTYWLGNFLPAATTCTFSTSQLPKVHGTRGALPFFTCKRALRHNSVDFFISHLTRWLRTFSSLLFPFPSLLSICSFFVGCLTSKLPSTIVIEIETPYFQPHPFLTRNIILADCSFGQGSLPPNALRVGGELSCFSLANHIADWQHGDWRRRGPNLMYKSHWNMLTWGKTMLSVKLDGCFAWGFEKTLCRRMR